MNNGINSLIAGLAVLGLANSASASGIITLSDGVNPSITVSNLTTGDLSSQEGVMSVKTNIGVWSVVITTGTTKPTFGSATAPAMDLDVNFTSTGAGNLTVIFSDDSFQSVPGTLNAAFTANPSTGGPATVDFAAYGDASNADGLTTLLANTGINAFASPFTYFSASGPISLATPYSLSEVLTISAAGASGYVFDGTLDVLSLVCTGTSGLVGVPYTSSLVATDALARCQSYTSYSIISGSLPPGLTLNPTNGAITGTPTTAGTYPYVAQVTDSCGISANTSSQGCGITITPLPSATCASINAVLGQPLAPVTLVGHGGCSSSYTFSATGLPGGLSMSPTGTISGTPTASGTFNYTFVIADSCGNKGTNSCSVMVLTPPSANCVAINAVQGTPIRPVTVVGSGGCSSTYTYAAAGLPGGLSMSTTGTISGTPTASGTFNYTFVITDSCGTKGTNNCSVTVLAPPSANCVTINAVQGTPITPVTVVGSGGCSSTYTYAATGLPTGLNMSTNGTISGTPTVSGTFNYSFVITDSCGDKGTNNCSVTVNSPPPPMPPIVNCPPTFTLTNFSISGCTYGPGDYGSGCNGTNAAGILTNCFNKVYPNGWLQCGLTNANCYWLKFTSCTNVWKFVTCGGTPSCLKSNYTNPTNCAAGQFAGQVLCLKLNVDFGDAKSVTGFAGGCGDLILNDSTCPLNGQSVRQILGLCHTALGGGNIASCGCTISNLSILCSNLNLAFENCTPSAWCQGHLVPAAITNISPAVTGYATYVDVCASSNKLSYSDAIAAGPCPGTYVITRTWLVVDGCGNSNSCTQTINLGNTLASVCGTVFQDCNGDGFLTPGIDSGKSGVAVTLKNSKSVAVATNLTDALGNYCFFNLTPGTYTVSIVQPTNHVQTAGTHTYHWLNGSYQQCWVENDGYQHCKAAGGGECWTANDGCQHWKNVSGQDCWTDKYGSSHTQACNYVSCDVPTNNAETFTLAACQNLSCVNFSYQGIAPNAVICVTGPSSGTLWQTCNYTCTVTNTGTACFSACQVTACGNSYPCPSLSPGQGCSFQISHQFQWWDCGQFNCQATANCTAYNNNSCTAQGNCFTSVSWGW